MYKLSCSNFMIFKVREPRSTGNIHYTLSYFLFKIDPYLNKIGSPSLKQIGPQAPNRYFSHVRCL